ncbi:LANO_0F11562g1_1 [Lachancea nothofagi CBS 11611]|uniref:LANO_0F11562g1_1 n=1 Tax=Lachancea nothofagi CBS 11611 TaxID=1266666 RepID=A0A1G4KAW5_9SACH|nr:LANO_0F11562g1_1 [Lachancea nothofagi CBS 11611]
MSIYSTPLKSGIDYSRTVLGPSNVGIGGNDMTNDVKRPLGTEHGSLMVSGFNMVGPAATIGSATGEEHLRVSDFADKPPLELASQYIDHMQNRDSSSPVLDERSYYNNGVNYNFSKEVGGLGAFTPLERTQVINIPDVILREAAKAEIKSDMGLFPELNRCWITIDNKLILWNLDHASDFQSIDDIKHTILSVALVRPKPNTFVESVNHLLLIATPFDIYVLAIEHNASTCELAVFNTGMCISVHGLDVSNFVSCEKTGQIFFSGKSSGTNIWELQYSSTEDWFNSKCNKVCLTQSIFSSLLPTNLMSKIPGSNLVQSFFEESSKYSTEHLIQICVDESRDILYSLSNKSAIRAYKINGKHLEGPLSIETSYIKRIMGTTSARGAAILGNKYLKISKLTVVSGTENSNLFLVAITVGGVRIYFNGSSNKTHLEALRLESIKFPPSSVTPEAIQQELQQQQQKKNVPFYSSLASSESVMLKFQKKSSVLLESTQASTIISPGIFFSAVSKVSQHDNAGPAQDQLSGQQQKSNPTVHWAGGLPPVQSQTSGAEPSSTHVPQQKLFVSIPDYGILKRHGKYVENATLLDTSGIVKHIVPISPLFNATNKPEGYANEFATQYTSSEFKVAVLTSSTVEIYRYRNPDAVFESLIENPLPFVLNYGLTEACSTALFVTCKFNKSEALRSNALTFFAVGLPGVTDIKPRYSTFASSAIPTILSKPSMISTPQRPSSEADKVGFALSRTDDNFNLGDVVLSPRFYGIALFIARLFRDIWDKPVFVKNPTAKFDLQSKLRKNLANEDNLIDSISSIKSDVEYYLSSVMILNDFFDTYGNTISSISIPSFQNAKNVDRSEEVANQAENIAINSLIKLIHSMKEAFSFLNVLFEESEVEGYEGQYLAFKDIIKFLNLETQAELIKLNYKDIFAPNETTKNHLREILSSIINRNISRGGSIEYIATALQERCGSFCSSSDILGFRAVEHLRKAKEIGLRDHETSNYHLTTAIKLFEKIVDTISIERLKEAVSTMIDLNYYPGTIKFLLNIANSMDKGKLAYQYVADGYLEQDPRKTYYEKRILAYELVFETLVRVDEMVSAAVSTGIPSLNNVEELSKLKEESYATALKYNDKLFHYHLYDWLVSQNSQEKLLQLDTDFSLMYLQEKSKESLEISNLLWVYQSKRSHFYSAAQILYSLVISDFEINLGQRIEYLSRANGFCNSVCAPNQRQQMIHLAGMIQEIFDVASVQDDILTLVKKDLRIASDTKQELIKHLDGKILPVSDLFNDYADPMEYYEVCLAIFRISDFRNNDEIISKWTQLFDSLKIELNQEGDLEESANFINLLTAVVVRVGRNVKTSEFVFPIADLFPIICDFFYENLPQDHIKEGSITSIFVSAGVSFDKLYYMLKNLIETADSANNIYKKEMVWLIKEWYESDTKLRDLISFDDVRNLKTYSIENDPIENQVKKTGISI